MLNVYGGHFVPFHGLICKFAFGQRKAESAAAASVTSTSQVRCITPPHLVGSVRLQLSTNATDLTDTWLAFSYAAECVRPVENSM